MSILRREPTRYHRTSAAISSAVGHAAVLVVVAITVLAWIGIGAWTSVPTEWLLITNLAGTVSIFLILLGMRHSQQMHIRSIHAKLDELIRVSEGGNQLIASERLADELLDELREKHREMAARDRS